MSEPGVESLHLEDSTHGSRRVRRGGLQRVLSGPGYVDRGTKVLKRLERGLPWRLSGKESACQWRILGFDPWAGKIPWRRKWQLTPVKSHGQRSLAS